MNSSSSSCSSICISPIPIPSACTSPHPTVKTPNTSAARPLERARMDVYRMVAGVEKQGEGEGSVRVGWEGRQMWVWGELCLNAHPRQYHILRRRYLQNQQRMVAQGPREHTLPNQLPQLQGRGQSRYFAFCVGRGGWERERVGKKRERENPLALSLNHHSAGELWKAVLLPPKLLWP